MGTIKIITWQMACVCLHNLIVRVLATRQQGFALHHNTLTRLAEKVEAAQAGTGSQSVHLVLEKAMGAGICLEQIHLHAAVTVVIVGHEVVVVGGIEEVPCDAQVILIMVCAVDDALVPPDALYQPVVLLSSVSLPVSVPLPLATITDALQADLLCPLPPKTSVR